RPICAERLHVLLVPELRLLCVGERDMHGAVGHRCLVAPGLEEEHTHHHGRDRDRDQRPGYEKAEDSLAGCAHRHSSSPPAPLSASVGLRNCCAFSVMPVSETWLVMPMVMATYAKSRYDGRASPLKEIPRQGRLVEPGVPQRSAIASEAVPAASSRATADQTSTRKTRAAVSQAASAATEGTPKSHA